MAAGPGLDLPAGARPVPAGRPARRTRARRHRSGARPRPRGRRLAPRRAGPRAAGSGRPDRRPRPSTNGPCAISEAALGPDHPDVGIWRNNLGRRARATWATWPAPAPSTNGPCRSARPPSAPTTPTSAPCATTSAGVLRDLGDLAGARAQFERALAISEAALGPDHPDVGTWRNNLGLVLQDLGDLAGARTQYERALAISEAALGPDHPTIGIRPQQPRPRAAGSGRPGRRPHPVRAGPARSARPPSAPTTPTSASGRNNLGARAAGPGRPGRRPHPVRAGPGRSARRPSAPTTPQCASSATTETNSSRPPSSQAHRNGGKAVPACYPDRFSCAWSVPPRAPSRSCPGPWDGRR